MGGSLSMTLRGAAFLAVFFLVLRDVFLLLLLLLLPILFLVLADVFLVGRAPLDFLATTTLLPKSFRGV